MRSLKLTALCILLCGTQSCMLTGKMNKVVNSHYQDIAAPFPAINYNDTNLIIIADSMIKVKGFCQSSYTNFIFVPVLFYNIATETIRCDINPALFINAMTRELAMSLQRELSDYTAQKQIELVFKRVPTYFYHKYEGHFMSPIIIPIWISKKRNELFINSNSYEVSYRVKQTSNDSIVTQGYLSYPVAYKYDVQKFNQTRGTFVKEFAIAFDYEIADAGSQMARNLVKQLKDNYETIQH